jgi:hypothetical protein
MNLHYEIEMIYDRLPALDMGGGAGQVDGLV